MKKRDSIRILETLKVIFSKLPAQAITALFEDDKERFQEFHLKYEDLIFDYSKTAVSSTTRSLLHELAEVVGIEAWRDQMFSGVAINESENRSALHSALRDRRGNRILVRGHNVMTEISRERERFLDFAECIRSGTICSPGGRRFSSVLSIGIGGSDLGPAMASIALRPYCDGPTVRYVSNVDAAHFHDESKHLDPRETLVILQSKTFTTTEVLLNAETARRWIADSVGHESSVGHLVAVTAAGERAIKAGIPRDRIFKLWDWVGGRYSLWSAIGLPLAIEIGRQNFERLLDGGHSMDQHFLSSSIATNIPINLGLIGLWHRIACGYTSRAVIPYDQRLIRLPAYLQQLDMESNGKTVCRDGSKSIFPTAPVVWGEPGSNAQHAFFQFLHQGTDVVPVEFIVAAEGHEKESRPHHEVLLSNCFAQSLALMKGRSTNFERSDSISASRQFEGQRPSITFLHKKLDPYALGRLVSLFEHRIFVEAVILGINPFDQWGVELGKEISQSLLEIVSGRTTGNLDSSTAGLISFAQDMAKNDERSGMIWRK